MICDCDAHRGPQKSQRFPRQEKAMPHCDSRVRWKVASDLRFRAAISEPKTPFFCGISGDLAPSTQKLLAIAIVRFWCAKVMRVVERNFLWVIRRCQASQTKGLTSGKVWELRGNSGLIFKSTVTEVPEKSPGNFWESRGKFWEVQGVSRSSGGSLSPSPQRIFQGHV